MGSAVTLTPFSYARNEMPYIVAFLAGLATWLFIIGPMAMGAC